MLACRRTFGVVAAALMCLLAGSVAATQASAAATATITGTVREAGTGVPVANVRIELFRQITRTLGPPFGNGRPFKTAGFVTAVESAADGTYALTGLAASDAHGYWVCFNTFPLAYEPACYLNELGYSPFPDPLGLVQLPPDADAVHVAAGQHVTRIDASLIDLSVLNSATAGTIAGKVTQTVFGLPLKQVRVTAFNAGGHVATEALTRPDGTYRLVFVAAGAGYRVCFDGSGARGGITLKSYSSSCRLVPVTVTAGNTTANINARLSATLT